MNSRIHISFFTIQPIYIKIHEARKLLIIAGKQMRGNKPVVALLQWQVFYVGEIYAQR